MEISRPSQNRFEEEENLNKKPFIFNMNLFIKRAILPIVIIVSLSVGFFAGTFYQKSQEPLPILRTLVNKDKGQPDGLDFSLYWDAWEVLHDKYVDKNELNTQDLLYGSIEGLVNAVGDPFTNFLRPKASEEFSKEIEGSFGGIGIEIGIRDDILTVIAPLPDTPAEQAGLKAKDKIIKIDGKETFNMDISEAVNLIRGKKGTSVILSIARDGLSGLKDIEVVRGDIKIPTVKWEMVGDQTAHIRLFVFNNNAASDFDRISKEVLNSGAKRVILDLRNNPGGLLDKAVNIAGHFLDPDSVVLREEFASGRENLFRSSGEPNLVFIPTVVLINGGSASASEIIAGALRDNKGITIVGETSFGKGSVQQVDDLSDGSSIKITIARWLTPNGISIDKNGIVPDVEVERTEEDINNDSDPQLDKAIETVESL